MVNDNEIVVRARDFKLAPDVEHYVQSLLNKGTLERLSKEGNLNADTIRNMPLGRMCDIFEENVGHSMESGYIFYYF